MTQEPKVNLVIEITHKEHLQIENICTEQNKSFTDYFMGLHRNYIEIPKEVKEDLNIAPKNDVRKKSDYKKNSIDKN